MRMAALVVTAIVLVLGGCGTFGPATSQPPTKTYPLTPDACAAAAAVVYSGRVAGSFLTTLGALRAMALFAQGDPWPGDPAGRAAAPCYVDVQSATASAPPGSGTAPLGPRDNVPVVAP